MLLVRHAQCIVNTFIETSSTIGEGCIVYRIMCYDILYSMLQKID